MRVRFLADEDLDNSIIQALRSKEPRIEIFDIKLSGLCGAADPDLLELAAEEGWAVVSHDRRTMTKHFRDRLASSKRCPGLFIVPQSAAIGDVIESLFLAWAASELEEWIGMTVYLPFR